MVKKNSMAEWWDSSHLSAGSSAYLEALYEDYLQAPEASETDWREFFNKLPANNGAADTSHKVIQEKFADLAQNQRAMVAAASMASGSPDLTHERKQVKVMEMINAFRTRGHQIAALDPLQQIVRPKVVDLELSNYGFTDADLDLEFNTGVLAGKTRAKLRDIYQALRATYCGTIGAEFTHITESKEREWVQQRLENLSLNSELPQEDKLKILQKLTAGEGLERYLHTKYVGQKRFSLEGGESLIPILDELIEHSGSSGIKEIGIAMAHRGRLNVLVNILGKVPMDLFDEFEGKKSFDELSSGDVKYHQGFSSDVVTSGGDVHLALGFNPSHLEIVSPVVNGSVRARQDRRRDRERNQVLSISIHGDSAFAGQGVVMETFNMSQPRGYQIGGTIHVIANNQIGFTTSNPLDTRSSLYCTDVAKMVQAPIFHVNGDDPEACFKIARLAIDYRMTFKKDVVIDLVCYRRHGHNEADEPSATQPRMYGIIRKHPTTRTKYAKDLVEQGVIEAEQEQAMVSAYRDRLQGEKSVLDNLRPESTNDYAVDWAPYLGHDWTVPGNTHCELSTLQDFARELAVLPENFTLQKQVKKMLADRIKMGLGVLPLDWGAAETLAYANILAKGQNIRISGQDSCRGTFAHRHAVLHDQSTGEMHIPLREFKSSKGDFLVIDSTLSEEAVLAFEYGYAASEPNSLVIWEAQFGDFANGAQVVIDQFISSGEHKWGRLCGLTMLLPHGYEGMGPEHSSARLERYLQLCAEHNIQVCVPTTPAQNYHMLCRQALRPFRKPLVVMSPKSLLRHKLAVSSLEELASGSFHPVLGEIDKQDPHKVRRVVLCSGKVYYDLLTKRRELGIDDIAIVRIEQLYPFPKDEFTEILAPYHHVTDIVWCQEEPMNQGAWYCTLHHLNASLVPGQKIRFVGREASAAPAAGYAALHMKQQTALVNEALA